MMLKRFTKFERKIATKQLPERTLASQQLQTDCTCFERNCKNLCYSSEPGGGLGCCDKKFFFSFFVSFFHYYFTLVDVFYYYFALVDVHNAPVAQLVEHRAATREESAAFVMTSANG